MSRRLDTWVALAGPMLLIAVVGIGSSFVSRSNEIHFLNALVAVAVVVAIYVFVGNSGVLSFGQISFVALGAFAAGVMTVPLESKTGILPDLFPLLRDHTIGNVASLAARGRGRRRLRVPRRPAADAPVRAGGRDRDVRRARDHAQPAPRVDEDRAGCDDALARPRERGAAGDRRRARGRRRRLRLPAQPARPEGAGDAGGSGGGSGRRDQRPPAAALGVHALRGALRLRRRPARAHARLDHDRAGLPGADVPDAGDAGRRRDHEPLGRRRRRARGQRPRLACSGTPRTASASASRSTCPRGRGWSYSAR